jgi:hypothetical protein
MTELREPQAPTPPPAPVPAGWEGILAPGERILWQGRPEPGVDWAALVDFRTPFGLFFAGFALFWMWMAGRMGAPGPFPLFGLPFLLVGLHLAFGRLIWDAITRRSTHYTLTDRTAFVATAPFGKRKLERWALRPGMALVLDDAAPGSVWFDQVATPYVTHLGPGRSRRYYGPRSTSRRIGFDRIAEARQVYGLMRQALANLSDRPPAETQNGTP